MQRASSVPALKKTKVPLWPPHGYRPLCILSPGGQETPAEAPEAGGQAPTFSPPFLPRLPSVFSRTLHNDAASRVAPGDIGPGQDDPGPPPDVAPPHEGSPGSLGADWGGFLDGPALGNATKEPQNSSLVLGNGTGELGRAAVLGWVAPEPMRSAGRVGLEVAGEEL